MSAESLVLDNKGKKVATVCEDNLGMPILTIFSISGTDDSAAVIVLAGDEIRDLRDLIRTIYLD